MKYLLGIMLGARGIHLDQMLFMISGSLEKGYGTCIWVTVVWVGRFHCISTYRTYRSPREISFQPRFGKSLHERGGFPTGL